jgi:hypothetical protein
VSHSISLPARDLHTLFKATLPFVGPDFEPPAIRGINLTGHPDGVVRASATDKYTAAACKVQAREPDVDSDFVALIPTDAAKNLLRTFKGTGVDGMTQLTLTVDDDGNWLQVLGASGASMTIEVIDRYPAAVSPIFAKAIEDEPNTTTFGINPQLGKRLTDAAAAVGEKTTTAKVRPGSKPSKPVLVTVGENLLVLLMPRTDAGQAPDATDELTAWADLYKQQPTTAGAA